MLRGQVVTSLMDSAMNNLISDQLHVAQQSRREKLRVQLCSPAGSGHRVDDYTGGLEVVQPIFNSTSIQAGDDARDNVNLLYHLARTSSELLIDFSNSACNNNRDGAVDEQASVAAIDGLPNPRRENNIESCGVWKSVGHNSSSDNWSTDCVGRYRKNSSQGFVSDISAFKMKAKHSATGLCQSQIQYGDMNYSPQPSYHNALNDEVTTAVLGLPPNWTARGNTCTSFGLPYGYQSDGARVLSGSSWNGEITALHSRRDPMVVDPQSQGLSLSLCSNPASSMITGNQFGDSHITQSISLHTLAGIEFQDSLICSPSNFVGTATSVEHEISPQELMGPSITCHRQIGPFGPFTGYATILKSSRFLKPAQQLLDEYCGVNGIFTSSGIGVLVSDRNENGDLATAVNYIISEIRNSGDVLAVSSSTHQDCAEIIRVVTSSPGESRRPDYQLKKAKLLYMLEEVSRKYKQYHQQMQMVVSAFECVSGLAAATPYISCALKSVSKHFNHLKNAISDQLRHIKTFLGEDFLSPPSGIRDEGDTSSKRSKYADYGFPRQKSDGSNVGLLEPQQHIWRPQRGLPERAVSVLRAWLFEHFLHPYPTDTDKHMLATQTGLTRNQVSNWFINARVRLWKPMVEEVHMLETKGVSERKSNAVEEDNVSTNNVVVHLKPDQAYNKMVGSSVASVNLDCSGMGSLSDMREVCAANQWNREKRSRVGSHNTSRIDEGMMGSSHFHHQIGHEMSGIESISLTLGLRQSADQMYRLEGNQHQHQQLPYLQQQQDHMRQLHLRGHNSAHEYAG